MTIKEAPVVSFIEEDETAENEDFEEKLKTPKECLAEIFSSDWLYLVLLGISMGICSFFIDICIQLIRQGNSYLFTLSQAIPGNVGILLQYSTWTGFTMALIALSCSLCFFIAPQAVGSGIPELRTILQGNFMHEYLTLKTLPVKLVGLILSLGTCLPLGKEGPFVHISSILAVTLSKFIKPFHNIYENDNRIMEMLAAACAVGVAGTYGAPIGGVLFSIEVTSVFFPLRSYYACFLATVFSAITFRLFSVWFNQQNTVVAFSRTFFPPEYPFDPKELFLFALLSIICGLIGALFIWIFKNYVQFINTNKFIGAMKKINYLLFPLFVTFLVASLRFPRWYGKFTAGGLSPRETIDELFSNFSWTAPVFNSSEHNALVQHWSTETIPIYLVLILFILNMFWMTIVSISLPIPSGAFIPVFAIGAALGRLFGEILVKIFPNGLRTGSYSPIMPGAYALVGAAAFSGAVTHAISTSVIVFEITGQFLYILPVIGSVVLARIVCSKFQNSMYDTIIQLKKLPYLPSLSSIDSVDVHKRYVADIMRTDVKFLSFESSYRDVKILLEEMPSLSVFPLVDKPTTTILIGTINRKELVRNLELKIGHQARKISALRQYWSENLAPNVTLASSEDQCQKILLKGHRKLGARRVGLNNPNSQNQSNILEEVAELNPENQDSFTTRFMTWIRKLKLDFGTTRELEEEKSNIDFSSVQKNEWESVKLNDRLNFDLIQVDPAPFQLVEHTTIFRAHALFSILGLHRAYVTCLGSLIGEVTLKELRNLTTNMKTFHLPINHHEKSIDTMGVRFSDNEIRKRINFYHSNNNNNDNNGNIDRLSKSSSALSIANTSDMINRSIDQLPIIRKSSVIKNIDLQSRKSSILTQLTLSQQQQPENLINEDDEIAMMLKKMSYRHSIMK